MSRNLSVLRQCPHCEKESREIGFIYSSQLKKTESAIKLYCGVCKKNYSVPNVEDQTKHLSHDYGKPSQIEQLKEIRQLSYGDIIAIYRVKLSVRYQHHAVVTKVDYKTGYVTVIEFTSEKVIKKSEMLFDRDIKKENSWVRRYMPLDCLPVTEVVAKAESFLNEKSQPKYDLFRCNCQHLSSWCKTGEMRSDEADQARWLYHFIFHGMQALSVFSIFAAPAFFIGMAVYTCGDTLVSMGRVLRTEFDLMEKGMKDEVEALLPDATSLAISSILAVGAALMMALNRKSSRNHTVQRRESHDDTLP